MKQAILNLGLNTKKTRKREFLEQMEQVVPWSALLKLIALYYTEGRTSRSPFFSATMLRVYFMPQWFTLSDTAMEEAFFDTPLYREFAQLEGLSRFPDESTILRFRNRVDKHKLTEQILVIINEILTERGLLLKTGTVLNATLIAAHTSTKNKDKARDPEMHANKKDNQWYFGMKAHIGVDAESGLVHTIRRTSGHVSEILEANTLLHDEEIMAFGDAGYQGVEKRADAKKDVTCQIAIRPGKRRVLDEENEADALFVQTEKLKSSVRAKVEHPLLVIKRQFGFVKVRYRVLKKNTAQLFALFALSNLWIVRCKLMRVGT